MAGVGSSRKAPGASVQPGAGSSTPRTENVTTTARHGRSKDRMSRERRYVIAMSFRIVCFVLVFFVGGWLRWVLLAAAAVLPGIAVLIANAVDRRGELGVPAPPDEPVRLALTSDTAHVIRGEVEVDPDDVQ